MQRVPVSCLEGVIVEVLVLGLALVPAGVVAPLAVSFQGWISFDGTGLAALVTSLAALITAVTALRRAGKGRKQNREQK